MPVIILSGYTDEEEHSLLTGMGADDIIMKPFQIGTFLAAIERHIAAGETCEGESQLGSTGIEALSSRLTASAQS